MSDQHEREQLDHIEQLLRFTDPGLVQAIETGRPRDAHRRLMLAARVGGYVLAGLLLVAGAATINILLFMLGCVVLSLAGCLHVAGCVRRRRHDGWPA